MTTHPNGGVLALLAALQRAAALAHDDGREEMSRKLFAMSETVRREVFGEDPSGAPKDAGRE
jgi:hypothetical protein